MPNTGSERPARSPMKQDATTFSSKLPSSTKQRFSSAAASACPSFRIYYYDGAAGSIPFEWETQPGTPKHPSSELPPPPPLTPPPSHFSFSGDQNRRNSKRSTKRILAFIQTKLFRGGRNNKKSKKLSASSSQSMSERVLIGDNEYDVFKFQTKRKVNRRLSSFDSVASTSVHYPVPTRSTSCFRCFIW